MIMGHSVRISLSMLLYASIPALFVSTVVVAVSSYEITPIFLWLFLWVVLLCTFLYGFPAAERKFIIPFVTLAILARLAVAVYFRIVFAGSQGLFFPDEFYYYYNALNISEAWERSIYLSISDIYDLVRTRNYGFHIYNALHYVIFEDKILTVISNIFFDVLAALLIYRMAFKSFGRETARLSFVLIALNPYNIYYSAFLVKDILLAFLIVLFFYIVQDYNRRHSSFSLLFAIMSLLAISSVRFYLIFILVPIVGVYFLVNREYVLIKKLAIGTVILFSIGLLYFYSPLRVTFDEGMSAGWFNTFQSYSARSIEHAQSKSYSSRHIAGYDIKSLSISFSHFLLAPSPFNWSGDGKYQFLGVIYWYFLFPYFVVGNIIFILDKTIRKREVMIWLLPLVIITIIMLMPAINEPRHRIMMMPFATIIASIGFTRHIKHKKLIILASWVFIIASVVGREFLK